MSIAMVIHAHINKPFWVVLVLYQHRPKLAAGWRELKRFIEILLALDQCRRLLLEKYLSFSWGSCLHIYMYVNLSVTGHECVKYF